MATVYVLTVSGTDKAKRVATRSWYVKEAAAVAWLGDPSTGAIKDFTDGYIGVNLLASNEISVRRAELPLIPGLIGSNYRGNQVKISGSVITNGIGSAITTSIPARDESEIPVVGGTTQVLVEAQPTDPNGYDPAVYVNWNKFITGYEAIVDSEEGGDVTNVLNAYLND